MKRLLFSLFSLSSFIFAQSPPNMTANTTCTYTMSDVVATIAANFNCARNQEETQLSVVLPDIAMPTQTVWDAMNFSEKALHLINQERIDRAVSYSGITPKALPLEGYSYFIKTTAQSYADYLVSLNEFGHEVTPAHPLGLDPFTRINNTSVVSGCKEFLARGENIYAIFGSLTPFNESAAVARAVWSWVYRDAGSLWGHREAVLLQDYGLTGAAGDGSGFDDNFRTMGNEGLLGIGVKQGLGYRTTPDKYGVVVLMKFFDPINNAGCNASLPINLVNFTTALHNQNAQINWYAPNAARQPFVVEKADVYWENGIEKMGDFTEIAFLPVQTDGFYQYQSGKLPNGTYAFRLKQITADEGTIYSEVQKMHVAEQPEAITVDVFPNPFTQNLNIQLLSPNEEEVRVAVFNISGQAVLPEIRQNLKENATNRISLSLEKLPKGMYLIRLKSQHFSKTLKVVKG